MNSPIRNTLFAIATLLLAACASTSRSPAEIAETPEATPRLEFNHQLFGAPPTELIDETNLFTLTPLQQQQARQQFQYYLNREMPPHEALAEVLHLMMDGFNYHRDTLVAEEALRRQQGNCMSLAIITTALARLFNIEYGYREINSLPVFDQQDDLLVSSSHVQTLLYSQQRQENELQRGGYVVVDYFPDDNHYVGSDYSYDQFISLYYRNIASDALLKQQPNTAFHYAMRAYQADPHSPELLNLLAVLHRRKGDEKTAEAIYLAALAGERDNLAVLNNYILLLDKQGRGTDARRWKNRLAKLNDPNPYNWLTQARQAHRKKQYSRAIHYYREVLRIAPYIRPAYVGLYQIYATQGREEKAADALQDVLRWTYEKQERKRYHFKLAKLKQTT